jgi:hypothetical protein
MQIRTVLQIQGRSAQVERCQDFMKGNGTHFDFNNLIEEPKDLFQGNLSLTVFQQYGDKNWFTWRMRHWGVKTNAQHTRVRKTKVQFDTPDTTPMILLEALSRKYPTIIFHVRSAGEVLGTYILAGYFKNGKWTDQTPLYKKGSQKAFDFSLNIWDNHKYREWGDPEYKIAG